MGPGDDVEAVGEAGDDVAVAAAVWVIFTVATVLTNSSGIIIYIVAVEPITLARIS